MTTALELTNKINTLRAQLGLEPLKYTGVSKLKLQSIIAHLEEQIPATAADLARQAGMSPKAFRAKLRRHKAKLAGLPPEQVIAELAKDHRKQ
jgi:lambda repressor-like predicted transcriptional regulator